MPACANVVKRVCGGAAGVMDAVAAWCVRFDLDLEPSGADGDEVGGRSARISAASKTNPPAPARLVWYAGRGAVLGED